MKTKPFFKPSIVWIILIVIAIAFPVWGLSNRSNEVINGVWRFLHNVYFYEDVTVSDDVIVADDVSVTGTVSSLAGLSTGSATDSLLYTDTVELTNANIKALRATHKTIVAAPGAGKFVEVVSVVLILDYGAEVLTESTDNLVVQYATSGDDITAAIEMTGYIDQAADTVMIVNPANPQAANAASDMANNAVELFNTGDGEFGGNASLDTTLTVKVTYRIHATGL